MLRLIQSAAPNVISNNSALRQRGLGDIQKIIDRTKQLRALPTPLSGSAASELDRLISLLKALTKRSAVARFSLELGRRRFPTADFFLRAIESNSQCGICDCELKSGEMVLFARSIDESVCLVCPFEFEGLY